MADQEDSETTLFKSSSSTRSSSPFPPSNEHSPVVSEPNNIIQKQTQEQTIVNNFDQLSQDGDPDETKSEISDSDFIPYLRSDEGSSVESLQGIPEDIELADNSNEEVGEALDDDDKRKIGNHSRKRIKNPQKVAYSLEGEQENAQGSSSRQNTFKSKRFIFEGTLGQSPYENMAVRKQILNKKYTANRDVIRFPYDWTTNPSVPAVQNPIIQSPELSDPTAQITINEQPVIKDQQKVPQINTADRIEIFVPIIPTNPPIIITHQSSLLHSQDQSDSSPSISPIQSSSFSPVPSSSLTPQPINNQTPSKDQIENSRANNKSRDQNEQQTKPKPSPKRHLHGHAHQMSNQYTTISVSQSSDRWFTPPFIINSIVHMIKKPIDLDPASEVTAQRIVASREFWTEGALEREWHADVVFLNPPFSRVGEFVRYAV
ncbi:MAG: hypothetical protein EZS28_046284, partial [Streblomastix strix]